MAWKAAGGAAGVSAGALAMASVVVLSMSLPSNRREWAVALIATLVSGTALGSYAAVHYLDLPAAIMAAIVAGDSVTLMLNFAILGGVIFTAGLPGWFLVRAVFRWMDRRSGLDAAELISEAKKALP